MKFIYHLPILKVYAQIEGGFFDTAPGFLSDNFEDYYGVIDDGSIGENESTYNSYSSDYGLDTLFDEFQKGLTVNDSSRLRDTSSGSDVEPPGMNVFDFLKDNGTFDTDSFTADLLEAVLGVGTASAQSQLDSDVFELSLTKSDEIGRNTDAIGRNPDVIDNKESRYFFTTSTTTTSTTTTTTAQQNVGMSCWKCDAMTYASCASNGRYEECQPGDLDCCFVEVREKYQSLQQLCTGCKAKNACENLMRQNFVKQSDSDSDTNVFADQCRPNYYLQRRKYRYGSQQSVCRQCFNKCNSNEYDSKYCFGSIQGNTGAEVMIPFATNSNKYVGVSNPVDTLALGIPTWLLIDQTLDATALLEIENFNQHNIYVNDQTNGKVSQIGGNNERSLDEMTYWSLQGGNRAWWRSDLKNRQDLYQLKTNTNGQNGCVSNGVTDGTLQFTGCSAFDINDF